MRGNSYLLMKRLLPIFLIFPLILSAQPVTRYSLSATAGMPLKGTIIDNYFGNIPILGGAASVEFLSTDNTPALRQYNNATIGLTAGYLNLTNDEMLGQAFSLHTYLNIPFVNRRYFEFGLRPGVGLAFVTKNYYNTVSDDLKYVPGSIQYPHSNGAFGSYTNALFTTALYCRFPIKSGWAIEASYGWYHISNGSIRQPNSGINMLNGQVGVSYQPHYDTYNKPQPMVPKGLYEGKRWDVELSISGGLRQAYFADNRFFGIGVASVSAHWRPFSIFKIGAGIDAFYDGYYRSVNADFVTDNTPANVPSTLYKKTYLANSDITNCFRVGISVQPEFVIGDFELGLHAGLYVYDPIKDLEPYSEAAEVKRLNRGIFYRYDFLNAGVHQDGWLYFHIVMKYHCTDHLFVLLSAKSHGAKVEFFSAGLGVSL